MIPVQSMDVVASGGVWRDDLSMLAGIHGDPLENNNFFQMQGSGGDTFGRYIFDIGGTASTIIVFGDKLTKSVEQVIEDIRLTFDLSVSDFSEVMNTTRKTVYNWIGANKITKQVVIDRLFSLNVLAEAWREEGFANTKNYLRQPVIDGRSVYDLLSDELLNNDLIMFAGRRLALSSEVPTKIADPFG